MADHDQSEKPEFALALVAIVTLSIWLLGVATLVVMWMQISKIKHTEDKSVIKVVADADEPQSYRRTDATIGWRTAERDGASPADVLRAVAERIEYEQTTPLGSDRNARALVEVLRAIAILDGKQTEKDGIPIIE